MAALMQVKLLKGKVISGSVFLKGHTAFVTEETARRWIEAGEATKVQPARQIRKKKEKKTDAKTELSKIQEYPGATPD